MERIKVLNILTGRKVGGRKKKQLDKLLPEYIGPTDDDAKQNVI